MASPATHPSWPAFCLNGFLQPTHLLTSELHFHAGKRPLPSATVISPAKKQRTDVSPSEQKALKCAVTEASTAAQKKAFDHHAATKAFRLSEKAEARLRDQTDAAEFQSPDANSRSCLAPGGTEASGPMPSALSPSAQPAGVAATALSSPGHLGLAPSPAGPEDAFRNWPQPSDNPPALAAAGTSKQASPVKQSQSNATLHGKAAPTRKRRRFDDTPPLDQLKVMLGKTKQSSEQLPVSPPPDARTARTELADRAAKSFGKCPTAVTASAEKRGLVSQKPSINPSSSRKAQKAADPCEGKPGEATAKAQKASDPLAGKTVEAPTKEAVASGITFRLTDPRRAGKALVPPVVPGFATKQADASSPATSSKANSAANQGLAATPMTGCNTEASTHVTAATSVPATATAPAATATAPARVLPSATEEAHTTAAAPERPAVVPSKVAFERQAAGKAASRTHAREAEKASGKQATGKAASRAHAKEAEKAGSVRQAAGQTAVLPKATSSSADSIAPNKRLRVSESGTAHKHASAEVPVSEHQTAHKQAADDSPAPMPSAKPRAQLVAPSRQDALQSAPKPDISSLANASSSQRTAQQAMPQSATRADAEAMPSVASLQHQVPSSKQSEPASCSGPTQSTKVGFALHNCTV